jgi:hypothetical protein
MDAIDSHEPLVSDIISEHATHLNNSSTKSSNKTVTFSSVTIHEHPTLVGCNPAVSAGVPLTIDWQAVSSSEMSVDEFESYRAPRRVSNPIFLRHDATERWTLLKDLGFDSEEMRVAEEGANVIRISRQLSNEEVQLESQSHLKTLMDESKQRRRNLERKQAPRRNFFRRVFPLRKVASV